MFRKTLFGLLGALLVSAPLFADEVALKAGHPDHYAVVKGDTLWDISGRFLQSPWLWPEVWEVNPQIRNPHLIYPGDVIVLTYVDGKPRLSLQRGRRTVKLSPHVRSESLDQAIPTIPIEAIKQFLDGTRVVAPGELERLPYIVDLDDHLIGGTGQRIYVRELQDTEPVNFTVYREGKPYVDPDTNEHLGIEAVFISDAELKRTGDPATLELVRSDRESLIGDRLMPAGDDEIQQYFMPHPATDGMRGKIIAVVDGVSQIGQYQVVVLNRGERDSVEVGHVMEIDKAGEVIRDTVTKRSSDTVQLPDEASGHLMVFRVFDKVSYALVVEATRSIHVNDVVKTP